MSEYAFFDHHPAPSDVRAEVLSGLRGAQKTVSPKFFYDEDGSLLFEQITQLPEYYLTRTELQIFDLFEAELRAALRDVECVVEYGSGSNMKIRRLLEIAQPEAYVPVDISKEHLQENAKDLFDSFPQISVYPVCADITQPVSLPEQVA